MANNARIPNITPMIAAGINPKTGLPIKFNSPAEYKTSLKKIFRIIDEQNAIHRYNWHNLPDGLTGPMIERMLYYKGQLAFFYVQETNKFYCLPYTLKSEDGVSLDCYGRYKAIQPLTFQGTGELTADKKKDVFFLNGISRKCQYEVILEDELDEKTILESAVLITDYCKQFSQINISRQIINDDLLDMMAEAVPFARTALIVGTGAKGMRVNDEDQYASVELQNQAVIGRALRGMPWNPIIGQIDFQDLGTGSVIYRPEDYLVYLQSLDNIRLSTHGIGSGGVYEKKAHLLQSEQAMNNSSTSLTYQDGLRNRQIACDIINSIWGLGIYCTESEIITMKDTNMDGDYFDDEDQSGTAPGTQEVDGVNDVL